MCFNFFPKPATGVEPSEAPPPDLKNFRFVTKGVTSGVTRGVTAEVSFGVLPEEETPLDLKHNMA